MSKSHINQKRFIKRVAKSINNPTGLVEPIKEYLAVYPNASRETARTNSSEILNSELGKKTLSELLAIDCPKTKRSKRLNDLMTAEKDHVLQDGTIIPIRDNQSSLRALELMAKLDGETSDGVMNIDARSVNIQLDANDVQRLADVVKQMTELRSSVQLKSEKK